MYIFTCTYSLYRVHLGSKASPRNFSRRDIYIYIYVYVYVNIQMYIFPLSSICR